MTGKQIRLNRLFKHCGRLLVVPMDHGVTLGPMAGLTEMNRTVTQVAGSGADAVVVHKGLVRQIAQCLHQGQCELIVHLSASTALAPDANQKVLVSSVEHAIRLGAAAVSVHINLAGTAEPAMLSDLGKVAERCDLWGMPLLAMMYVRDGLKTSEYDPKKIQHAARIAEELGADIVKVNYSGSVETFAAVTQSIKIPLIIAGGPKLDSTYDLLVMIADAVQAGARGVAIGRNVFQATDPARLTGVIRRVLDQEVPREMFKELAATC